jgi:cytoskeletal protein CcmA (bactofilin family)
MEGEISFSSLIRIDGTFEGRLISSGSLVIGSTGTLRGDIDGMRFVVVEGGKVVGNVSCEALELKNKAEVHGNISCRSLSLEHGCVICGTLNVHSKAPKRINSEGKEVELGLQSAPPKKAKKETLQVNSEAPESSGEETKETSETDEQEEQEETKEGEGVEVELEQGEN